MPYTNNSFTHKKLKFKYLYSSLNLKLNLKIALTDDSVYIKRKCPVKIQAKNKNI